MDDLMRDRLIQELHQGVFGVAGTDEKGLVGDMKNFVEELSHQKRCTDANTAKISKIWGVIIAVGFIGSSVLGIGIALLVN